MIYWDTSCVVKLYTCESDSEAWEQRALSCEEELVASALLETELAYTFVRKEQGGDLRRGASEALLGLFREDVAKGRFVLYPVGRDVLRAAADMAERCTRSRKRLLLRTLDGIHLATALLLKCTAVATVDRRMRAAADLLGVDTM